MLDDEHVTRHEEGRFCGKCIVFTTLINGLTTIKPFFVHRIYQLDYSRKTGEYRMLERFVPQVSALSSAPSASLTRAVVRNCKTVPRTAD